MTSEFFVYLHTRIIFVQNYAQISQHVFLCSLCLSNIIYSKCSYSCKKKFLFHFCMPKINLMCRRLILIIFWLRFYDTVTKLSQIRSGNSHSLWFETIYFRKVINYRNKKIYFKEIWVLNLWKFYQKLW